MNYNILLIDDGLGSVSFMKKLEEMHDIKSVLLIDNKNYPYALRKRSIFALSVKLLNKFKAENYIVTNPAIAVNLDKSNRCIINGLKKFYERVDKRSLVLTNKYFADYLSKTGDINSVDAQILSNQVQFFDTKEYIVSNILDHHLKEYEYIYFMDSNFYVLKDFILNRYADKKIYFIQDFIIDELDDLNLAKHRKDRSEIFVTMDRRSIYLNLEDIYDDSFMKVKNIAL